MFKNLFFKCFCHSYVLIHFVGDSNLFLDVAEEVVREGQALSESIFARGEVVCCGQLLGLVVAETPQIAVEAARAVKISYQETQSPVITIEVSLLIFFVCKIIILIIQFL